MAIDVRIVGKNAQLYRRSNGHVIGHIGTSGAIVAVCNGEVVALLYADGQVKRYNAATRRFIGSANVDDALTLAITIDCLAIIGRTSTRYFDPWTGISGSRPRLPARPIETATAIQKLRGLTSERIST
jgi:hypothetical protein